MGRRIVFLGPPGAGKGTQAALVANALNVPHISTGAIFRAAVASRSELGEQAQAIMAAGDLVPDTLTSALVAERIGEPDAVCGYLLDGFPRTLAQAAALDSMGNGRLDNVLLVETAEDELVARLLRRAAEVGRSDDNETTIRRRLEVYREQTEPLVDFYQARGLLRRVDGLGTVEHVFSRIMWSLAS
ncbi:MAG: adenylate kinase [Acidimicrobiia bacterium]